MQHIQFCSTPLAHLVSFHLQVRNTGQFLKEVGPHVWRSTLTEMMNVQVTPKPVFTGGGGQATEYVQDSSMAYVQYPYAPMPYGGWGMPGAAHAGIPMGMPINMQQGSMHGNIQGGMPGVMSSMMGPDSRMRSPGSAPMQYAQQGYYIPSMMMPPTAAMGQGGRMPLPRNPFQVVVHNLPWECSDTELKGAFVSWNPQRADIALDALGRSRCVYSTLVFTAPRI